MPLVDYEYSDDECESDENEELEQIKSVVKEAKIEKKTEVIDDIQIVRLNLPAPKVLNDINVEEEDDEFLKKKPIPVYTNAKQELPKRINGKVQIAIPSLKDFKDEESNKKDKSVPLIGAELPKKPTGLLSMLPKPKGYLASSNLTSSSTVSSSSSKNMLIPHSVANRTKKSVTEKKSDHPKQQTQPGSSKILPITEDIEDDEDEENLDFFSFSSDNHLPEVSMNEINAMVAQRAAKMAEAFKEPEPHVNDLQAPIQYEPQEVEDDNIIHKTAIQNLIGGNRAKRARTENINIIDISSQDIIPNKEEFERTLIMSKTGFTPTGNLVGDWTCTSKRKSHVTYLAEKAKANEQELEAMWSLNRQTKRQTQSKYGF